MPRQHVIPKEILNKSLEVLLSDSLLTPLPAAGLPPAPTNLEETKEWLQQAGLCHKINVFLCVSFYRRVTYVDWICAKPRTSVQILAYRDQTNHLAFSSVHPLKQKIRLSEEKKSLKRKQFVANSQATEMSPPMPPNAFDHNRSASVSVDLKGLTAGVKLGLVTQPNAK